MAEAEAGEAEERLVPAGLWASLWELGSRCLGQALGSVGVALSQVHTWPLVEDAPPGLSLRWPGKPGW